MYSNTFTISMGKKKLAISQRKMFLLAIMQIVLQKKTENTVGFSRHSAYNDHDNGELWWPRCSIVKFKKKN